MASEDLEAIDRYISTTPLHTKAAEKIHDEWRGWYDGLGWLDKNSNASFDHGRNLRNQFNLANTTSPAEKELAQRVVKEGITNEEMAGGTRRTLASGMYAEPLISEQTKMMLVVGGALAVGSWVLSLFF